jgi:alpha-glucosidase (family GH31 glycosyl hydrolase)
MDSYRSFTYDKVNFKGLPDFITNLHSKGMKYVPILDAGLAYRPGGNYDAFNDGVTKDVFMKINGEAFIG